MEFEDRSNALFVEPNAYIQNYNTQQKQQQKPKKIVFQEPYDCLPSYYIDNGFKKRDHDYVSKPKQKSGESKPNNSPFGFDLKSLMHILGMFNKNEGGLGNILSALDGGEKGFDFSKIVGALLRDKNSLSRILNLFKGKKTTNSTKEKDDIKTTDFEIENYTKV